MRSTQARTFEKTTQAGAPTWVGDEDRLIRQPAIRKGHRRVGKELPLVPVLGLAVGRVGDPAMVG